MWGNLLRVDWEKLTHAYGWARNAPLILTQMISNDEKERAAGWDGLWGSINHQGDFYSSTVAAIPFLIEATSHVQVPERANILDYLRSRWLDAPDYGGDPILAEPPGGIDEPTPMLTDVEFAEKLKLPLHKPDEANDEEFDIDSYRRMDLCAWQTGRAIQEGRPTFKRLLRETDRAVAAAAAELLLLWPETRVAGKKALIQNIEEELDPIEQGKRILELGVYGEGTDVSIFERWAASDRPLAMRAAAALAWAWTINPTPLPPPAAKALHDASLPDCNVFASLPWNGVFHRGPWILPGNAATLVLRLADNENHEIRWRGVQGLAVGRETSKHLADAQIVPILIRNLPYPSKEVREAAALALSQREESLLKIEPDAVSILLHSLGDTSPSVCGHCARLLAALSPKLTPNQKADAISAVDRAAKRVPRDSYVSFDSMGIQASSFLKTQRSLIQEPPRWDVAQLFAEVAFPSRQERSLTPLDCDRRLASAYRNDAQTTVDAAIREVRSFKDRNMAIGAAYWLMTLGPAAQVALPALEQMAEGKDDPYARDQARSASEAIRRSLSVETDLKKIAAFEASLAPSDQRSLLQMLEDTSVFELGISGEFENEGRLFHWRQERRSPRAAAIRTFFEMKQIPGGDVMLRSMLAESVRAAMLCGKQAAPHRFPISHWKLAVAAAGGQGVAEPMIRAARQESRSLGWSGKDADNVAFVAQAELSEVIRQLSGRLV